MKVQDMPNEVFQLWYHRGIKQGYKDVHDKAIARNNRMTNSFTWSDGPEGDDTWRDIHESSDYIKLEEFYNFEVRKHVWFNHKYSGQDSLENDSTYYVKTTDGRCHLVKTVKKDCNVRTGKIQISHALTDRLHYTEYSEMGATMSIISASPGNTTEELWMHKCIAKGESVNHPIASKIYGVPKPSVPKSKKSKFKIGDRVIVTKSFSQALKGEIGTIVSDIDSYNPGVEFDNFDEHKHDLNGACEDGYGWYVSEDNLELYSSEEKYKKEYKSKFKVGDRIRMIKDYMSGAKVGEIGTIVNISSKTNPEIAVEFDTYHSIRHRLTDTYKCRKGYGWYVPEDYIQEHVELHDGDTIPVNHTTTVKGSHHYTGRDAWAKKMAMIATMEYPWEEPTIPKGGWMHLGADPYEDNTEFKLQTHKKLDIF